MSGRDAFLHDVPLERARERFEAALREHGAPSPQSELIPLDAALDRVAARPVLARLSSPHYDACAMDGIAVRAAATSGARETAPLELELGVDAYIVDTGDPLPSGFDAVVPIERVEERGARVAIRAAVAPYEHVRTVGEDIIARDVVVPASRRLGAADLAACAAAGVASIEVVRRPRVAIVTTGDELVDVETAAPARGAILDSNAVLLAAAVRSWGGDVAFARRVRDEQQTLREVVAEAIA
ncbi:MAG: molybdopterin biosynthesis protein, partial [Candidatus Eremiobacteraeota bacterium]|nr:molybdopterin biosynthesis protein [Candidatus Eremiobacteraeota bacterium]